METGRTGDRTRTRIGQGLDFYKLGGSIQDRQTREGLEEPTKNGTAASLKLEQEQARLGGDRGKDRVTRRSKRI